MWPARRSLSGRSAGDILDLIEGDGLEPLEHAHGVVERVKRECRLVLGEAVAVCVFGILLLQVAGIRQQYLAECRRRTPSRRSGRRTHA